MLQGLAEGPGSVGQHAQPCSDHFEVVVTQQLQREGHKLGQLLLQDVGLCRPQACQAALDLLNGIGACLHVGKGQGVGVSDVLYNSSVCHVFMGGPIVAAVVVRLALIAMVPNSTQYGLCSVAVEPVSPSSCRLR